jgi:hypothetical protein
MIALEVPSLTVFVRTQPMSDANVAAQHQSPIATIQAHYIVVLNGLPH